jgi:trigger factor
VNQKIKTFENVDCSVEATEEAGCRLNLKIFMKPKATEKCYQKAVKQVNKQVSIPGFRKGHAPDRTIVARYSSSIEQEWKELLVNEAYRSGMKLTEIYPMSRESVEKPKIESCSQESGAVIRIIYEHYPDVPTIDFSILHLSPLASREITVDAIAEVLEEVRKNHADWEDVHERAVQKGDFVDVTIDSLTEDPPQSIVKDRRFEVDEKHIAPWLMDLVIGLKTGESVEGMTAADPAAEEKFRKNFKSSRVQVTLNGIKKILLSPLDDAFAKKMGADSLEDLQQKVRHNLEEEARQELKQKQIGALDQALLETYHFDLPASLVEEEREERIARKIQALKKENLPDEEIKGMEHSIEKEVAGQIDTALRLYFLTKKLISQCKITLSNAELNQEIERQMRQNPYMFAQDNQEQLRAYVSRLSSAMLERKAKEYVLFEVLKTS